MIIKKDIVDGKYYNREKKSDNQSEGMMSYIANTIWYYTTVNYYYDTDNKESSSDINEEEYIDIEMLE